MNAIVQPDMFFHQVRRVETPAARSTDDDTSHIAADKHTASGKRHTNLQAVVDVVRVHPGMTSAELSKWINLGKDTYHEVARRLPEAVTAGAVLKGYRRHCLVNGSLAMTWWPAT